MDRMARALDLLIEEKIGNLQLGRFDTVVVGSGYGGTIAAREILLRDPDRTVLVLERGKEYLPGDFAQDVGHLPAMVRVVPPAGAKPVGYADALFDFRLGDHVDILQGSGLGGTSLINASVARRTQLEVFQGPRWPDAIRIMQPEEWDTLYNRVERMLEVVRLRHDPEGSAEHPRQTAFNRINPRGAMAELVPLVVKFTGESACTHCGNCVAGCNVGAKRGVFHQLMQHANRTNLQVLTNALVKALSRTSDGSWDLLVRRTTSDRTPVENEEFTITAGRVILAAGALGSTEILKRSELLPCTQDRKLRFSPRLGSSFSTNGDGLLFGFGQQNIVGASAAQSQFKPTCTPGPTITNAISASLPLPDSESSGVPVTIENCVVPYLLEDIYGELVTTAAQLGRLGQNWLPALHADGTRDPLRASPESIAHTQALLVMGDDGANGELKWFYENGDPHGRNLARGRIEPVWRDVARNPVLVAVDHFFRSAKELAFDGGQYVPNPAWQLLPPEAATVLSGALPGGRALTVHPLGGCGMGQDARLGVVNDIGQVFQWSDRAQEGGVDYQAVHDGLYVLDGSILPAAVGTNPLLTISALVLRAMDKMLGSSKLSEVQDQYVIPEFSIGGFENQKPQVGKAVNFTFYEVMYEETYNRKLIGLPTAKSKDQYIGVVRNGFRTLNMRDLVEQQDYAVDVEFALKHNSFRPGFLDYSQGHSLSRQELAGLPDMQRIAGTLQFFPNPKKPGRFELKLRAIFALLEYHQRRVPFPGYIWKRLLAMLRGDKSGSGLFKEARSFWNVALQQAQYRSIEYNFNSVLKLQSNNSNLEEPIVGRKSFGFGRFNRRANRRARVWDIWIRSLFSSEKSGAAIKFTVDTNYKSVGFPYSLTGDANLVEGLLQMGRFGLLLVRNIFATSFWEFGAPDYEDLRINRDLSPRPLNVGQNGNAIAPRLERLRVPLTEGNGGTVDIELTHYAQAKGKPILLVHGLAQGSLIFTADNGANMATAFFKAGFDVWLVDHRLSNRLIEQVALGDWSYEEIGQFDLRMAIEHIYRKTSKPVNVFAHCVGATAIEMGLLRGWIPDTMIDSLVINAIHPWVEPSPVNGFRAFFGAMLRGMTSIRYLDPLPSAKPTVFETLLDRVVFSLARFEEEPADAHYHKAKWVAAAADVVCDRMSGLYGRMWRHENMTKALHADLVNLVGPAPISVYRHLYYFVMRRKITDREGRDVFITPEQLMRWKCRTLFLHGADSHVFSPISAVRSAVNLRNARRDFMLSEGDNKSQETVFLKVVPEHGHMDVIFGAKAHREVFVKCLIPFFNNAGQAFEHDNIQRAQEEYFGSLLDRVSPGFPQCRKPAWDAGPILRRVTVSGDDVEFYFLVNVPRTGPHVYMNYSPEWLNSPKLKELSDLDNSQLESDPTRNEVKSNIVRTNKFPEYKVLTIKHSKKSIREKIANNQFHYRDILKQILDELEKLQPSARKVSAGQQQEVAGMIHEIPDFVGSVAEKSASDVPEWLRRRVSESETDQRFSFAIGSCRYPGSMIDRERSDAIFAVIDEHVTAKAGIDAVFFIGDQIYSDATASLLDPTVLRDKYIGSYEEAFTSTAFRHLACRVPVHFAIDDHELADNWSGNADVGGANNGVQKQEFRRAKEQFEYGRDAALAVYARHKDQDVLWYEIEQEEGMPPCFVMDCRSERSLRKAVNIFTATMISERQLTALLEWLSSVSQDSARKHMPKFIFSGGVLAPVSKTLVSKHSGFSQEDGWLGYPKTASDVLTFIAENDIAGVVFVGGDLHFSAHARIDIKTGCGKMATVHQVMSSGLYAPLPFASQPAREFSWNHSDTITLTHNGGLELKIESRQLCKSQSHFLRLDAQRAGIPDPNVWEVSLQPVTVDAQVLESYKFNLFGQEQEVAEAVEEV